MKYYQCRLVNENAETIAWIEERGAKVGASVELKTADGKFWNVKEVYSFAVEEEYLRSKQQMDRNSLPSIK